MHAAMMIVLQVFAVLPPGRCRYSQPNEAGMYAYTYTAKKRITTIHIHNRVSVYSHKTLLSCQGCSPHPRSRRCINPACGTNVVTGHQESVDHFVTNALFSAEMSA